MIKRAFNHYVNLDNIDKYFSESARLTIKSVKKEYVEQSSKCKFFIDPFSYYKFTEDDDLFLSGNIEIIKESGLYPSNISVLDFMIYLSKHTSYVDTNYIDLCCGMYELPILVKYQLGIESFGYEKYWYIKREYVDKFIRKVTFQQKNIDNFEIKNDEELYKRTFYVISCIGQRLNLFDLDKLIKDETQFIIGDKMCFEKTDKKLEEKGFTGYVKTFGDVKIYFKDRKLIESIFYA